MPGLLYIKTFGCQMNEYDSGKMRDVLEAAHGMTSTDNPAEADVLLVNTCSVREKAQEKVFSLLGEWRLLKLERPHVVIGVGINVSLPAGARREIETAGTAVAAVMDACQGPVSRNMVAGAILDELLSMLVQYERFGFSAFRDAWTALDGLKDRQAQVVVGGTAILGVARGVDSDGALLLETGDRMQRFVSGEASLRLAHG